MTSEKGECSSLADMKKNGITVYTCGAETRNAREPKNLYTFSSHLLDVLHHKLSTCDDVEDQ